MQDEQPVKPANIANIVATNQGHLPLTMATPRAAPLSVTAIQEHMAAGAVVIDSRSSAEFGAGHIPGAYNVHLSSGEFEQRIGWITDLDAPLILCTNTAEEAQRAIYNMAFIALDPRVVGYLDGGLEAWLSAGQHIAHLPQLDVFELQGRLGSNGLKVLDVRETDEWVEGHIRDSLSLSFKLIPTRLEKLHLDPAQALAITCQTGKRSSTAASMLLREGFTNLYNVIGGMTAWESAGMEMVNGVNTAVHR
jgi:hydroxyacylglutathione hydrolase